MLLPCLWPEDKLVKVVGVQAADLLGATVNICGEGLIFDAFSGICTLEESETIACSSRARPLTSRSRSPVYSTAQTTALSFSPASFSPLAVSTETKYVTVTVTATPRMVKQVKTVRVIRHDCSQPTPSRQNVVHHASKPSTSHEVVSKNLKKGFPHSSMEPAYPQESTAVAHPSHITECRAAKVPERQWQRSPLLCPLQFFHLAGRVFLPEAGKHSAEASQN